MLRRGALAICTAALALGGCDEGGGGESPERPAAAKTAPPPAPDRVERPQPPPQPEPARCPADAVNCAAASGTIVYVEAVDPDGDGDAHLVLASREGITGPGISVVDVPAGLRPDPLPRVGDAVSAAGPIYRGSHGQRQIQATVLHP